jgi:hypothetical protein
LPLGSLDLLTDLTGSLVIYATTPYPIASYSQLLHVRTLMYNRDTSLYKSLIKKIISNLPTVDSKRANISEMSDIAMRFINEILFELQRGKDVAWYNLSFGYGAYAEHCIFC